jgi:hypothetical protein
MIFTKLFIPTIGKDNIFRGFDIHFSKHFVLIIRKTLKILLFLYIIYNTVVTFVDPSLLYTFGLGDGNSYADEIRDILLLQLIINPIASIFFMGLYIISILFILLAIDLFITSIMFLTAIPEKILFGTWYLGNIGYRIHIFLFALPLKMFWESIFYNHIEYLNKKQI